VGAVGINPIEYRAWKGERSAQKARMYVIARSVFKHKMKALGVIVILALGFLMVHAFQLIVSAIMPHEVLDAQTMYDYMGSGNTLSIFAILLAAVVTSDLISEDLAGRSFVLYFSRAVKVRDYLVGKGAASFMVMGIMCFLAPVAVAIASIATQSGGDYSQSAGVLARTAAAGALFTVFFVPYGMMMSSFTKRKSYAAVGTFMSFFVLMIVAEIFAEFDPAWRVISPADALSFATGWIFGVETPEYVNWTALAGFMAAFITVPAAVVYLKLKTQVVGG
jgi:ABC-type transport system involved in multi-copper enzyme maturation permease subunit